jgi:PAS domain S-box-containing protein
VTRLVYDDDDGALVDTLGYVMDVTGRRQADEAVREREATLQVVINASPDIITILDAEGGIRSMSPAVHRILGRPPVERVGRSAFGSDIIHPDDLERFSEAQRRVLTGQAEHAAVRLRARHADGRWLTLEAYYSRPLAALAGALLALSLEPVAPGRRRRRDGQPDPPPGRPAQHPVVILSADARPGLIQRLLEQGRAAS